ncbi:MAG: JAB domain-containing protein [Alphaproteobacteria bacterium]|nr:JAB domain-containing protein [Alphaproteobacteria bacterium]
MAARGGDDTPHHVGHRARLRQRFLEGGPDALPDYELLELILFLAHPRIDVKPLAKALLKRFDSFAGAIGADPKALTEVKGVGETTIAALKTVQAAAVRLAREEAAERPVISSWDRLLAYCRTLLAQETTERVHVIYLDTKNALIRAEAQGRGTIDHTPLYPREVVKRALELGAAALILVHNHPSGDPTPSRADIQMTREVAAAGKALGIAVHDHLIIGKRGHASFRSLGLL